ncbi:hypothetical protein [Amycolatopsis magusensis]|uniref:hypothetical protein n=1 Tax=Amycolatopsis magusensis TaxID=882444 RepID=UPI003C2F038C
MDRDTAFASLFHEIYHQPEDSAELRALRDADLMGLLDHLDALWNAGVLPQQFALRGKRRS